MIEVKYNLIAVVISLSLKIIKYEYYCEGKRLIVYSLVLLFPV